MGRYLNKNVQRTAGEPIARHWMQGDSEGTYSKMGQNMSNCHIFVNSSTFQMFCYLEILGVIGIKCSHNK